MLKFRKKLNSIGTILILAGLIFFCFYEDITTTAFLGATILVLVICALLYDLLLPSDMEVNLEFPDHVHIGDEVVYHCKLKLRHAFPVFHGILVGQICNYTTSEQEEICIPFSMWKRKEITFSIEVEHAGVLECRLDRIELSGLLSLYHRIIHPYASHRQAIFPELVNLPMEFRTDPVYSENGEEIILGPNGYDPAVYDGVRPYRDGDSMKWIHWNLTGKLDEYMVRELGRPATVLPGLFYESSFYRKDLTQQDRLLGVYLSISVQMLSDHLEHEWVFWDDDKAEWVCFRVAETEDLEDALLLLGLCPMPVRESATLLELPSHIWKRYNQMTYVADLPSGQAVDLLGLAPVPMNMLVGEGSQWNYYDAVV